MRDPKPIRMSRQTRRLIEEFLEWPGDRRYGYELSRATGLKSGTLYPILMRLAEHKLLDAQWETSTPGAPPRHMYRLTSAGVAFAREHAGRRRRVSVAQPAFSKS